MPDSTYEKLVRWLNENAHGNAYVRTGLKHVEYEDDTGSRTTWACLDAHFDLQALADYLDQNIAGDPNQTTPRFPRR